MMTNHLIPDPMRPHSRGSHRWVHALVLGVLSVLVAVNVLHQQLRRVFRTMPRDTLLPCHVLKRIIPLADVHET